MSVDFGSRVNAIYLSDLVEGFVLDEELFEQGWTNLSEAYSIILMKRATINRLLARMDLATEHNIEQLFKSNNLPNIASGEEDNIMKMYFYGRLQVNESSLTSGPSIESVH